MGALLIAAYGLLIALAAWIIWEDLRTTWVDARAVFGFAGLATALGAFAPGGPGLEQALLGASVGFGLGLATRVYITWRTGVAGFGAADIVLLGGCSAFLGPVLTGPFVLTAVAVALLMMPLPGLFGLRKENIEGETHSVLPLCPALILAMGLVHTAQRFDLGLQFV